MNLSVRFANAKRTKRVLTRAIACSILLILPSCCIPNLRQSELGLGLPENFNGANNNRPTSSGLAGAAIDEITSRVLSGGISTDNSAQLGVEEFYNDPTLTFLVYQAL